MDVFSCPLCGAVITIARGTSGQTARCPQCGGLFQVGRRADEDVIDVHAEVIGGHRKPPEDASPEDSPARGVVHVWEGNVHMCDDLPPGRGRGYVRYTERYYRDDSGCCLGIGCALVFLLCFLLLRGCLSFIF